MITAKNIHKYYEKLHVLKGVDLHIKKGEIVGLVGESGSGKSTLGRAIASLIPYEGDISYEGKNLKSNSSKEAKELKKHVQIAVSYTHLRAPRDS